MEENRPWDIGDEIAIYCRNCRHNLWGNVTAVEDGRVLQVTCRTCRTVQDYQPEKSAMELRQRVLKRAFAVRDRRHKQVREIEESRASRTAGNDVTARWRKLTEEADARHASPYRPQSRYDEGDFLIHREHGFGVVVKVLHENAVLALFRKVELPLEMGAAQVEVPDEQ